MLDLEIRITCFGVKVQNKHVVLSPKINLYDYCSYILLLFTMKNVNRQRIFQYKFILKFNVNSSFLHILYITNITLYIMHTTMNVWYTLSEHRIWHLPQPYILQPSNSHLYNNTKFFASYYNSIVKQKWGYLS